MILGLLFQGDSGRPPDSGSVGLVNKGPADAPLRGEGRVTYSTKIAGGNIETEYKVDAKLTNISAKPIAAIEAIVDMGLGYRAGTHGEYHFDSFFEQEPFMPGSSWDISEGPRRDSIPFTDRRGQATNRDTIPAIRKPVFEVRISFVRFADGSEFGASKWGSNLLQQRSQLAALIRQLLAEYDKNKEGGLSSAIDTKLSEQDNHMNDTSSFLVALRFKLRENGVAATADYLTDCLQNAQQHKSWR